MILIQATVAIIYQYVGSREELSPFSETLHLGGGFSSNSSHRTYENNTEISCVYDVNFLYSFIDILHYLQNFFLYIISFPCEHISQNTMKGAV